jgi:hypothetical protein
MKLENEKVIIDEMNKEPYKWYEALRWIEKKRENLFKATILSWKSRWVRP